MRLHDTTEPLMALPAPHLPEDFSREELLERAEVLAGLAGRLERFAAGGAKATPELAYRVRDVFHRYGDLSSATSLRPGTPLEVYFRARLAAVRAALKLRIRL